MKLLKTVLFVSLLTTYTSLSGQVLSQFDWELGGSTACNCETAVIGPNGAPVSTVARAKPTGNGSPNGLSAGLRFGFLREDIDFYVAHPSNNSYFNVPSIELQIDYRDQYNELAGNFFSRWDAMCFGFDVSGIVMIGYQIEDGFGGFIQIGTPRDPGSTGGDGFNAFVNSSGVTATNTDVNGSGVSNWHTYTFRYDQTTGYGEVLRDGISSWSNTGIPGSALYWGNATSPGFYIGGRIDGNNPSGSTPQTSLDNAFIRVPTPLPVEINYFAGKNIGGKAYLEWETATESNNDFFRLERLLPQEEWEDYGSSNEIIGIIDGNGTKSSSTQYSFTDLSPRAGENIYLLRQIDLNGQDHIAGKLVLNFSDYINRIEGVYPNPLDAGKTLHLKYQSEKNETVMVNVYDISGARVLSRSQQLLMGMNDVQLNTSDLPAGMYILKVEGYGHKAIEKFVITK